MKHYVGLDVSMKVTFVCIENEQGKVVHQGSVRTDPGLIAEYIKKNQLSIDKVGIESGSISYWLVEELKKAGIPAICIDARKMAAVLSVQVNKTDKNDAKGIAQAMRCGLYREVSQKSQKAIGIGTLMKARRLLVEEKIRISNAIRGFLKAHGIRLGVVGEATFTKKAREYLSGLYEYEKPGIESLLNVFEAINNELKKLTSLVEGLARNDEDGNRLMTIPGVGAISAMTYIAEIDDPQRFENSRSVGAYLGMTPTQYSSGEIKRQGRVSKCGSAEMRCLLNEAAVVLLSRSKKWSKLKAWGLKIQKKHGFKKACMAVGRKLAVIMHRMWIDKTNFVYGETEAEKEKSQRKSLKEVCVA
jgi:transposase